MPKVMAQPSAGEGRGRRGRRVATTLAEINVIPLVDVMLVLLIIFMVAAPMMQRGVEVKLPTARNTQKMSETRMYVTIPLSYRTDRRVLLDDEAVSIELVSERIKQAFLSRPEREVFLRGDNQVMLQELLEVFDRLKQGGIENVGIVALQRGQP
jgi:biopolymer transport protein TolR